MVKRYFYILAFGLITFICSMGFGHAVHAGTSGSFGQPDNDKISSTLSPNPAKDKTTLKFQQSGRDSYRMEVYDLIGNQVKTVENIQNGSVEIDLSDLEAGMYFYFLIRGSDRVSTGRLVIRQ